MSINNLTLHDIKLLIQVNITILKQNEIFFIAARGNSFV